MSVERKKLLITGAAGRVGGVLTEALKDRYDLVLVDILPVPELETAQCVEGNVCDPSLMESLCRGVHTVIHLAIGGNVWDSRKMLEAVNVGGSQCVFRAAAHAGCQRVIFASSITIELFDDNEYAEAKKEIEEWAEAFSKTVPMSILCLRLGNTLASNHPAVWPGRENLSYTLTHRDLIQLFESTLLVSMGLHYGVFTCVSVNEPLAFDIEPARRELGFDPHDDAYVLARQNARCLRGRVRSVKRLVKRALKAMLKL